MATKREVKAKATKKSKTTKVEVPTAEQLLEAGVHFGHLRRRWHPKMAPYIYTEKDGIHIFDLFKTRGRLEEACRFLQGKSVKEGILFVGTKKQAQEIVRREAARVGAYFLAERWVGGLLTNFKAVRKNIEKLEELSDKMKKEKFKHYTKKERLLIEREIRKLERDIGGLKGLKELPQVLILASARNEAIAAREGQKTGVPVVAIADTNADPELIDYIIPGNDDAAASIEIIIGTLADAVARRKK